MRSNIADYNAVVETASKFTRSVAEGNSKYAKELFTEICAASPLLFRQQKCSKYAIFGFFFVILPT